MNVACKGRVRDLTWRLNIVQIFLALIVKTSWFHLLQPLGRLKWSSGKLNVKHKSHHCYIRLFEAIMFLFFLQLEGNPMTEHIINILININVSVE